MPSSPRFRLLIDSLRAEPSRPVLIWNETEWSCADLLRETACTTQQLRALNLPAFTVIGLSVRFSGPSIATLLALLDLGMIPVLLPKPVDTTLASTLPSIGLQSFWDPESHPFPSSLPMNLSPEAPIWSAAAERSGDGAFEHTEPAENPRALDRVDVAESGVAPAGAGLPPHSKSFPPRRSNLPINPAQVVVNQGRHQNYLTPPDPFIPPLNNPLPSNSSPSNHPTYPPAPARPASTAPAPEPVHPYDRLRSNGHTGFVLLTSGSSGTPKALVHDLDRFLSRFDHRRPAGRTLAVLGLDHIGGLNTLFHTLLGQGTLVIPPDRDPIALARTIERWRVEVLPATPTCLRLMLHADAWQRHDLSSLRLITYGAEPMTQTALDGVRAAAPQARLLQTYGSSELGILRTRSLAPGSLGITVQHAEVQVRNGVLWVRSPHSMLGYLNAPSPFDPDGWCCTGDRVELIDGALRIVSRTDRLINIGGEKVDPTEIETVLEQIPGILSAHVRSNPSPWTGEMIAADLVLEHPEDPVTLRNRVRRFCSDRLPPHKIPVRVQGQQGLPMTDRLKKPSHRVLLPETPS